MQPAAVDAIVRLGSASHDGTAPGKRADTDPAEALSQEQPELEACAGGFMLPHGAVHPWHAPACPTEGEVVASPSRPVLVTANPMVQQTINGSADARAAVPINGAPFAICSPVFEGIMEVHLRGLPNSQPRVFEGRKRFFHIMVQGRFKCAVAAGALAMGQEFVKPGRAPAWVGELIFTAAAKVFSSSTKVDAYAPLPYFMNPLLAACQLVNASRPGSEPRALADASEDVRLWAPELADQQGRPLCSAKRRRWCDVPSHLEGRSFGTELVWTFHIYQHLIDFAAYKLSVAGFLNVDLAAALNAQPLQLTCKDTDTNEYSFSLLVWHERLLYGDHSAFEAGRQARLARLQRLQKLGSFLGLLSKPAQG